MSTTSLMLIGIDLVAALVLAIGLFYRRHHRRDLVVAFLGVNVGVMAVALGLGLGLFGVLSIIRLRSSEISQHEVAYYFAALAIGLISGLPQTNPWPVIGLIALILAVMWVADHPRMFARTRQQVVRLDRAISDESEIREELSPGCRHSFAHRAGRGLRQRHHHCRRPLRHPYDRDDAGRCAG